MRTLFAALGIVAMAFALPACRKAGHQGSAIDQINQALPPLDPGSVAIDAQNNDAAYYNLSVREFSNGVQISQVDLIWPVMAAQNGVPSSAEKTWIFQEDSASVTHQVVIFDQTGLLLDQKPFVKGAVPLTVIVTITSAVMTVQTSP